MIFCQSTSELKIPNYIISQFIKTIFEIFNIDYKKFDYDSDSLQVKFYLKILQLIIIIIIKFFFIYKEHLLSKFIK